MYRGISRVRKNDDVTIIIKIITRQYMYVCVCMYVYVCVYVCTRVYVCMCVCMYVCMCAYVCI